jgi:hypothetical protein
VTDDVVAHPRLDDDQLALVRLMQFAIRSSDYVAEWRHLFQGAMIRATTVRGKRATLQRDAVQGLVDSGILMPSHGGSFYLTDLGRGI